MGLDLMKEFRDRRCLVYANLIKEDPSDTVTDAYEIAYNRCNIPRNIPLSFILLNRGSENLVRRNPRAISFKRNTCANDTLVEQKKIGLIPRAWLFSGYVAIAYLANSRFNNPFGLLVSLVNVVD